MVTRFLLKILLFASPILLFLIYAEIGLSHVPTSYSILKENYYKREKELEVVFIGASDSQLGIAPKFFTNHTSYNLSNSSQSIFTCCRLIETNLERLPKLKLVVLCVSPILIFQSSGKGNVEQWREKFYYHFWNLQPEFSEPSLLWRFNIGLYEPKTVLLYGLKGYNKLTNPLLKNIDSLGWERGSSDNSTQALSNKAAKETVKFQLNGLETSSNRTIGYISELNSILKKKNIKLILVQLPISKYYLEEFPSEIVNKSKTVIDSLTISEHIPYYNFRYDTIYHDSDFRDVTHLNYRGAEKFSNELNKTLQTILD